MGGNQNCVLYFFNVHKTDPFLLVFFSAAKQYSVNFPKFPVAESTAATTKPVKSPDAAIKCVRARVCNGKKMPAGEKRRDLKKKRSSSATRARTLSVINLRHVDQSVP